MTRAPDSRCFPVEAFCLHCGLIQDGMLHAGAYRSGRTHEQVVMVHCAACGGVSRHFGAVVVSGALGHIGLAGFGNGTK